MRIIEGAEEARRTVLRRQPAGELAPARAPHAIGDRHAERLVGGEGQLLGRHVGQEQLLRAGAAQDDVVVLVAGPLQARVRGRAKLERQLLGPLDEVLRGRQGGRNIFHRITVVLCHGDLRLTVSMRLGGRKRERFSREEHPPVEPASGEARRLLNLLS